MKRGPKPKGNALRIWSGDVAYAIGLFTADGCIQKDGRHLDFTSTDEEQVKTFMKCLKIRGTVSKKFSGSGNSAFRVQFSDVLFYNFLLGIGLTPAKSKTINSVDVPDGYFRDFLRGLFDGDGSTFSYYDSEYRRSFRFYVSFASASASFISWLQERIKKFIDIKGHISHTKRTSYFQLRFSKKEAKIVAQFMYSDRKAPRLERKYLKIKESMRIMSITPGW